MKDQVNSIQMYRLKLLEFTSYMYLNIFLSCVNENYKCFSVKNLIKWKYAIALCILNYVLKNIFTGVLYYLTMFVVKMLTCDLNLFFNRIVWNLSSCSKPYAWTWFNQLLKTNVTKNWIWCSSIQKSARRWFMFNFAVVKTTSKIIIKREHRDHSLPMYNMGNSKHGNLSVETRLEFCDHRKSCHKITEERQLCNWERFKNRIWRTNN